MNVLTLVHGETKAKATQAQHNQLRNPRLASLGAVTRNSAATASGPPDQNADLSEEPIYLPERLVKGTTFERVILSARLVASRGASRRLIQSGGVYVGVPKWQPKESTGQAAAAAAAATDGSDASDLRFVTILPSSPPASDYIQEGGLLLLRMGKWKVRIIKVMPNAEYAKLESEGKVPVIEDE